MTFSPSPKLRPPQSPAVPAVRTGTPVSPKAGALLCASCNAGKGSAPSSPSSVKPAQSDRQVVDYSMVRISFSVPSEHAPALRSAVEEIRNEIGGRLEGPHAFATEHALTRAAAAIGVLAAAVNAKIPAGDPDYKARHGA